VLVASKTSLGNCRLIPFCRSWMGEICTRVGQIGLLKYWSWDSCSILKQHTLGNAITFLGQIVPHPPKLQYLNLLEQLVIAEVGPAWRLAQQLETPHAMPEFCDFVAGTEYNGLFGAFFAHPQEHYYSSFKYSTLYLDSKSMLGAIQSGFKGKVIM
jgi:hypothetical protein